MKLFREVWVFWATFMICLFGAWTNGYTWDEVAKSVRGGQD